MDDIFYNQLQLGKLLSTPFYKKLPLNVISPIVTQKVPLPYAGYYVNPDKTIDIYGSDRCGISLNKYWQQLVVMDIYGRFRRFLKPDEERTKFAPRIITATTQVGSYMLMPVGLRDLLPGDFRPVSEDNNHQDTVINLEFEPDHLNIHLMNSFTEVDLEVYHTSEFNNFDDLFYTLIPFKK